MNYKKMTFIALTAFAAASWAQTGKEWDDPTISSVNREKAHTTALPMSSESDVVKNDRTLAPS